MRYAVIISCLLFCLHTNTKAQLDAMPAAELNARLQKDLPDTMRVQYLLQLVLYYYFDHNESKPDSQKMLLYLKQAQQFNKMADSACWQPELDCYWGKYFILTGNRQKANGFFSKMETDIANAGNMAAQIKSWRKLGVNIRELDTMGVSRNDSFLKLMAVYQKLGDQESVIEMERAIADTHLKQGNLDIAEPELFSVIEHYKKIPFKNLHYSYCLLSEVYSFKGNYNAALHYALLTIESMRQTGDTTDVVNFYCLLANMYDELGQYEKSAEIYEEVFNRSFPKPIEFYSLRTAGLYTRVLLKQGKRREALSFIKKFSAAYPASEAYGKASLARTFAVLYHYLGNEEQYEKYIQQMIELAPGLLKNNEITQEVAYDLGSYYLEKKDFAQASFHFNHALAEASYVNCAIRKKDVYLMLFKTDSSLGNYRQAIVQLNNYRRLNDSIFNVAKNRQVQEVQVQYETEKKDQDLSIKDKNIQLLLKQSQLQLSNLRTEKNTRNMVLICAGLLVLLLALSYNRYKLKQRNNLQLEVQQKNIQEKNIHLEHLLQEKEWLVKEIHHRVKNNFHTVMGLLGTQSGYLRNEEAIAAMSESHQRVQSMSLIHQKLYQSENMSDINMKDYIHELVDYLKHSLNAGRSIQFRFNLDNIQLGVAHAVPVGLILNETITNAIKYAFPGESEGTISISFTAEQKEKNNLLLVVSDDGIGLPEAFASAGNNTMGMNLMRGLAKDIDGEFRIDGSAGTRISVAFSCQHDLAEETHSVAKQTLLQL